MKSADKKALEKIRNELNCAAENAVLPERLQKEFIVEMIKNGERKETDFSCKMGTGKVIPFRRIASIAAAFILITALATVFLFRDKRYTINSDYPALAGFEMKSPVRGVKSFKEIEKAVKKIIGENKTGEESSRETDGKGKDSGYVAAPAEKNPNFNHGIIDGEENSSVRAADIVKNDGKYLYIVSSVNDREKGIISEQIKIVGAVPAESMQTVSTIVLSNSTVHRDECFEIYLNGNSLIALLKRFSDDPGITKELSTVALFYDISDPTAPIKTREHIQDGAYVSSRIYGNRLCLITDKMLTDSGENGFSVPAFSVNGASESLGTQDLFMSVNDPENSYLFITLTNINNLSQKAGKLAILGSGSNIYCSQNAIYVSRAFVSVEADEQGNRSNLTEIYRFSFAENKIEFSGSCVLEGNVPSSKFLDEYNGYLRVASLNSNSGNIFILNNEMKITGELKNAFNISFIPNIKFVGSKAYIINAIGSGSLTVIDLSDVASPKSSIAENSEETDLDLFKVSSTKYIGFSNDGSSSGTVMTLYDIEDGEYPKAVSTYSLDSVSSLPDSKDERSFTVIKDKEAFGIPVIGKNPSTGAEISEYLLFDVSNDMISLLGAYVHDANYIGDAAVRAESIENVLYTVSGEKIVAFSIGDGSRLSAAEIR